MRNLGILIKRNTLLFFKDKGTFLTSLISPIIILILFVTFLGGIYRNAFTPNDLNMLPDLDNKLIEGFVGGWLISCLLAVSAVTIAFTANMCMVKDKATKAICDFDITAVKKSTMALGYYISTVIVTLIICYAVVAIGFIYISIVGWFIPFKDVLLILLDVFILVLFGTGLSSIVASFINSQGAITAVTTIVSSMYGFLCGAYMPISEFSDTIQKVIMLLPGTYATSLLHRHFLGGPLEVLRTDYNYFELGLNEFKKSFDIELNFFGKNVPISACYIVIITSSIALIGIYILINILKNKKKK